MSNFFDRNNIVHNATLLLVGFAGVTDGKLSKREIVKIKQITLNLLNRFDLNIIKNKNLNEDDFEILFETIKNHFDSFYFGSSKKFFQEDDVSDISHSIELIREISYAITQIKSHINFSQNLGDELVQSLKSIAHSDGSYDAEEKRWIGIIAKEFKD
jgi:hypothetical protein